MSEMASDFETRIEAAETADDFFALIDESDRAYKAEMDQVTYGDLTMLDKEHEEALVATLQAILQQIQVRQEKIKARLQKKVSLEPIKLVNFAFTLSDRGKISHFVSRLRHFIS